MKSMQKEYKRSRDEFSPNNRIHSTTSDSQSTKRIHPHQYEKAYDPDFSERKNYNVFADLHPESKSSSFSLHDERSSSYDSQYSSKDYFNFPHAQSKMQSYTLCEEQKTSTMTSANEPTFNRGLVGMSNIGNSCYLNAALQCLLHSDIIVNFFTQTNVYICENSPLQGQLAKSFVKLCNDMYNCNEKKRNPIVNPKDVKITLSQWADHFDGYDQEDAHEFLLLLINGLCEDISNREERARKQHPVELSDLQLQGMTVEQQGRYFWTRHRIYNPCFISDIFCGQFRSTVVCSHCGDEKYCFDPFFDLSLPLPDTSMSSLLKKRLSSGSSSRSCDECTLYECLDNFVNDEELSDSDKMDCIRCKKHQTPKKSLRIQRSPTILIIHLKRFSNKRRKRNTAVNFPITALDFSHFVPLDRKEKRFHIGEESLLYDLFAICHHMGTMNSGHYVASCLDQSSGEWFRYDDSHVSKIQSPEDISPSKSAYILFYKLRHHKR